MNTGKGKELKSDKETDRGNRNKRADRRTNK